jgi:hypothetical protein
MYRKITLEQEQEIIKLIEINSQKELANKFQISQSTINKIIQRNGIKSPKKSRLNMSKLSIDINYFKEIDNKNKAYWLGYICGDGNINKKNNKVTITSKDLEIIERFKIDINSGHKINENSYIDSRTNRRYNSFSIQITNELFTNNIINKGVTNNKTNFLIFPNIDNSYYPYFIAGLFDSDGCVSSTKKKIDIISTYEVLRCISDIIYKELDIKELKLTKVTENKDNIFRLYLYKDSKKFLDYIYGDNNFKYLSRKYKIYKKY